MLHIVSYLPITAYCDYYYQFDWIKITIFKTSCLIYIRQFYLSFTLFERDIYRQTQFQFDHFSR